MEKAVKVTHFLVKWRSRQEGKTATLISEWFIGWLILSWGTDEIEEFTGGSEGCEWCKCETVTFSGWCTNAQCETVWLTVLLLLLIEIYNDVKITFLRISISLSSYFSSSSGADADEEEDLCATVCYELHGTHTETPSSAYHWILTVSISLMWVHLHRCKLRTLRSIWNAFL